MNVVDNIAVRKDLDSYLSLRDLSVYSGKSIRTLRKALKDPVRPLPHYRKERGKILVRRSDFDWWMARFRQEGPDLERLVSEVLEELKP